MVYMYVHSLVQGMFAMCVSFQFMQHDDVENDDDDEGSIIF